VRDDFSKATVDRLAKRAGYLCSNPHCRLPTVGAAQGHDGVVNIGIAAHITAAAAGGPRYDATLSSEQRRDHSNGIWLCQIHGKLVDSDEVHFTVTMLREWRTQAEQSSFRAILSGQGAPANSALPLSVVDQLVERIRVAAVADLAGFRRAPGWPSHPIALSLRLTSGDTERQFNAKTIGAAVAAFNELVIVAPPGTGKTTTLLQIDEAILTHGQSIAVFVPLGEWALQAGSLFESLIGRRAFESIATAQDLKLLADSGRLILTLDGWNELDEASRKRASTEIKRLKREFPDVGIIISTRRQALDVPITAPTVHIDVLSEDQQIELSRALSGARGGSLLDHAWRTPGVRELVAIPLYLTALVTRTTDDPFPTTREEIIRLFIDEHEAKTDRVDELRRVVFGLHPQMLTALAVEATRASNTTISEPRARAAVAQAVAELSEAGQLTTRVQPTTILDGLISYHLVVKSSDGIAFQHQQFQEWYASYEVGRLMIRAARGEPGGREVLRPEVLNKRPWEESILFACERLSRRDSNTAQAVASAILETLGIDPMLAAQMIHRSSDSVWNQIKDSVIAFASRWHVDGEVDRAAAFMITTGRGEFAPRIWPLVANEDDQVSYRALRCAGRFRPSVLGANARDQIASLADEIRKVVLHEIAFYSGMDGIELASEIARNDSSAVVQIAVIEALLFRRADRFAAAVLRHASDEVWRAIANKGYYVARVSEPDVAERLQKERAASINQEADPLRKLAMLLEEGANEVDVGSQISSLIEGPEFPGRDEYGGVSRAYQLYPHEVTSALVRRVEAAREIPYWALDALRTASIAIDDGPIADLVLRPDTPRATGNAAAIVAGPGIVRRALDEIVGVHAALRAMSPPIDEPIRERLWRLSELIANANDSSIVGALLARPTTDTPAEIALLADQLARHHSRDERAPLRITDDVRRELTTLLARWVDVLLASADADREDFAKVARAIGRLALPELTPPLRRLLDEDLARWRASREAQSTGLERHALERSDAHTSWTLQYGNAFAAIGDDTVADLMITYLRDVGFCGFGVDAAHTLKQIWNRRRSLVGGDSEADSPFSSRRQRVIARRPDNIEPPERYGEAILAVVDDLVTSPSEESQRHALRLAAVAFTMPYGERTATIRALLQLPQPPAAKRGLLKVLAEAGETVPGDLVFDGIHALLDEAKTKPGMLSDQNGWELTEWLELLPFSDRATETIDALELLPRRREPWQMRSVLSALGRSPLAAADNILERLARNDARYLDEHDWFAALALRGSSYAARVLLEFISEGTFIGRKENADPLSLARKLAVGMTEDETVRRDVYERYERDPSGPAGRVLEYAIAEAPDDDGILLLIRAYAGQGRRELNALEPAIRHLAVGQRPSETFRGAVEEFSIDMAALRRRLFALFLRGDAEAQLAGNCLTLIDDLRDEHGSAESEPRHPDITVDRPWPSVA
jgi:hypothetical protein